MKIKNLLFSLGVAILGGFVAVVAYARLSGIEADKVAVSTPQSVYYAALNAHDPSEVSFPDFTYAAEKAVHCVVHVKVKAIERVSGSTGNPWFDYFFGNQQQREIPRKGSGSGVIISPDGYIITNNHVINKADEIEVTLNDERVFSATLVGADPQSDIALLKIDEKDLPYLNFGDSEALRVGEWVLAVGNPYNLTSTVTAGIVSAKARNLGMSLGNSRPDMEGRMIPNIEAYIQTDAAVNPGNSGGALVNTRGELVGINAAIVSPTGTFSGYSFAIPVTIAQKVVADLKEYGAVQRALLGISFRARNDQRMRSDDTDDTGSHSPMEVIGLSETGGAAQAGVKVGDIVKAINGVPVNSFAEVQVQVNKYRPGDVVDLEIERDGKAKTFKVTLYNDEGTTKIVKNAPGDILGAKFEGVSDKDKKTLRIRSGVRVKEIGEGRLKDAGVRSGFVITRINDYPVNSVKDVKDILNGIEPQGRVMIDGVYPNGRVAYYGFAK